MYRILKKRELTPVTKLFEVEAPLVARKARPGQFIIMRVTENGERIPLTIADYDPERGSVTIVVQEVGKTSRLIGALEEGDDILDFVGPLGRPAPLADRGPVVLVGGGFGVALILEEEMASVSDELLVATDDGTKGHKGFVTDVLKKLIDEGRPLTEVIAIGPMVMMRAVARTTEPYKLRTLVSVDPIMVDGTGMCGACRLTVGGEVKFACVDGPIFDAHAVDFDEAVRRGKIYVQEQKLALEKMEKECCGSCGCSAGGGE